MRADEGEREGETGNLGTRLWIAVDSTLMRPQSVLKKLSIHREMWLMV